MKREGITVRIEENLLRSARAMAERGGKSEGEIIEEALTAYLGFDVLWKVWRREGLPDEEESMRMAYEELHAMRAEEREAERRANRTG